MHSKKPFHYSFRTDLPSQQVEPKSEEWLQTGGKSVRWWGTPWVQVRWTSGRWGEEGGCSQVGERSECGWARCVGVCRGGRREQAIKSAVTRRSDSLAFVFFPVAAKEPRPSSPTPRISVRPGEGRLPSPLTHNPLQTPPRLLKPPPAPSGWQLYCQKGEKTSSSPFFFFLPSPPPPRPLPLLQTAFISPSVWPSLPLRRAGLVKQSLGLQRRLN